MTEETLSPATPDSLTKTTLSPDTDNQSDTASVSSSLRRPHRPPDLDLTSLNLTPIQHHDITIHTSGGPPTTGHAAGTREVSVEGRTSHRSEASHGSVAAAVQPDFDPTRSSTPNTAATKTSGSVSERVSLVPISHKPCESTLRPYKQLLEAEVLYLLHRNREGCMLKVLTIVVCTAP